MRTLTKDTKNKIGEEITLMGWVHARRDHGKLIFIDLRDRWGIVQVVFTPGNKELLEQANELRSEWVISLSGLVKERPEGMENTEAPTGAIEIEATSFQIISRAKTPPFPLDTDGHEIDEEIRMKYRYIDLRRSRMQRNLILRHQASQFIRNYLSEQGFLEVETPILTKSTPEGARDFIIPSRLQPGNFYALPQSPQQYKQLLMVAGVEKYFQLARCFRDEDPRADRAYGEFTQLDIEMSFVTQEDILQLTEDLFTQLTKKLFPEKRIKQSPWPRISHQEAQENYRSDKPDLRDNKNDPSELAFAWIIDFPLFTEQSEKDFFHGSGTAKFAPSHHMFTAPHPDDVLLIDTDPGKVRGLQHDLVLNGYEVGGGSIRIHQAEILEKVFDLIGFNSEQKHYFEHILTAFSYGVPPHGGIAPGLDRFLFTVLGEPSIRELIAFPASSSGQTSVMDAPSKVDEKQLKELHLKITKE